MSQLSGKLAAKIVKELQFNAGESSTYTLASYSIAHRQGIIKQRDPDLSVICAAIEVQRVWRGYCTRCKLLELIQPTISHTVIYSQSKDQVDRLKDVASPPLVKKSTYTSIGRLKLEEKYQEWLKKDTTSGPASFESFCADKISSWWSLEHGGASTGAEPIVVPHAQSRLQKEVQISPAIAASTIQRVWRKHIDIQVYKYYRDLINFKNKGDPSLMLRCINPQEAKYLDAAAGIHIRFRLAGGRFPPNIYYKIFTHRPVQDLCANSPKDYTKPSTKQILPKDIHNRSNRKIIQQDDTEGWYNRIENNGWRLVSDRLLHHALNDPVTWETTNKKIDYHHDKLQRKQDVELKKKKTKIQWMKKMYREGMLKAKSDDAETIQLIEGAAEGMVATVETEGLDALQEWEVDELLEWTTGLNFEDYQCSWKEIATSASSENIIEERGKFTSGDSGDPYQITLSAIPSRGQSAVDKQSHNTPISSASGVHVR